MEKIIFIKIESVEELMREYPNSMMIPNYNNSIMGVTNDGNIVYHYLKIMNEFLQKFGENPSDNSDEGRSSGIIDALFEISDLEDYAAEIQGVPRPIICKDDIFLKCAFEDIKEGENGEFYK